MYKFLQLHRTIKKDIETTEKCMVIPKINYNPEIHNNCYSYVLRRNDAIYLIKEIYPYLIIESKRKLSELILKIIKL